MQNKSVYFSASSLYMSRVSTTPIIRSTQNCNYSLRDCAATSLQSGQASLDTLEGGSCTVPEAIVTVLCTPDDGCGWHPKYVEWTCRIIDCFVLHLVGQLLILGKKERKKKLSAVRLCSVRSVGLCSVPPYFFGVTSFMCNYVPTQHL